MTALRVTTIAAIAVLLALSSCEPVTTPTKTVIPVFDVSQDPKTGPSPPVLLRGRIVEVARHSGLVVHTAQGQVFLWYADSEQYRVGDNITCWVIKGWGYSPRNLEDDKLPWYGYAGEATKEELKNNREPAITGRKGAQ